MASFIDALHFDNPQDKLTPDWCLKVLNTYWYNCNIKNLLWDKNVNEIRQYATGDIDMKPFLSMFKSLTTSQANVDKKMEQYSRGDVDKGGMVFEPFPLITEKLNSATAIINKIPLESRCEANDALAIEKKKKDIQFLKNKPKIQAQLQPISDQLDLGDVDLGQTDHSAEKYSDSPFGLDLNNPEEEAVFVNLLYALKIESSYETILRYFMEVKNILQIKKMEIVDQLYYAVSCNRAYQSSTTGLPDAEYVYPGNMEVPYSMLPDYSDNVCRFLKADTTVMGMFNAFGNEIDGMDGLKTIMTATKTGYCACNGLNQINESSYSTMKVNLKYCEVKSMDWVGVSTGKKSKAGLKAFTTDSTESDYKIWGQNTYGFWWLVNTKQIFGITRLGFAQRTRGQESYQNFTSNITRSFKKSAVELAVGENKKAQRADIKLQHAVIKSLPAGRYLDLRFLRNGLTGTKDKITEAAMQKVLDMAFEQNILMGDTTDFEGKNDGQFKPVIDLPGGLRSEVTGYMNIIAAANVNIGRIMGINEQLTGQSANPEGLIGLQKLLINSSINSLQYCTDAVSNQYQKLFSLWGSIIKTVIVEGGEPKQTLINIVGQKKVNIIDGLEDGDLHDVGIFIKIGQREEERARYEQKLNLLVEQGIISAADQFLLDGIENPRDKYALLAVKEIQNKKTLAANQQAKFAQEQSLAQQQGQNLIGAKQAEAAGEKDLAYAKGEVTAHITQLAGQIGLNQLQIEGLIKQKLQTDRNQGQMNKNIAGIQAKSNADLQAPLV